MRHLKTLTDLSTDQINALVTRGLQLQRIQPEPILKGKTLALYFTKKSTRTRVSAEAAWAALGGHSLFLGLNDFQNKEPLRDTATVIGSMVDTILARVHSHDDILTISKYSKAPVINALSDKYHPLQILADLMTIRTLNQKQLKVAWIGDTNNVCNSLLLTLPRLGIDFSIATPKGYSVDEQVMKLATKLQQANIDVTNEPHKAVVNADIIMTDTWVSMGEQNPNVLKDFQGFQVTESLGREAKSHWKFMHCLPRYSLEVDDQVFYGPRSLVFEQAMNRKYSIMAVFEFLHRT